MTKNVKNTKNKFGMKLVVSTKEIYEASLKLISEEFESESRYKMVQKNAIKLKRLTKGNTK
jgi:hypothetical protein